MGMNRFDRRFGEKERILDRYIDYEWTLNEWW